VIKITQNMQKTRTTLYSKGTDNIHTVQGTSCLYIYYMVYIIFVMI